MKIKEDIIPRNKKGEAHGYWEIYDSGKLWYEGDFINGKKHGLSRSYRLNGDILSKRYSII